MKKIKNTNNLNKKSYKDRSIILIFIAYVWTKTLLGLALQPYRSVQEVNRNKILTPVLLSPVIGLILLFLIGRIGSLIFELSGFQKTLMAITLSTALISILLWQILLLYLYIAIKIFKN